MSDLSEFGTTLFTGCNWHFSVYAAIAGVFLVRACIARRDHRHEEARDHIASAIAHLIIAILSL